MRYLYWGFKYGRESFIYDARILFLGYELMRGVYFIYYYILSFLWIFYVYFNVLAVFV